MYLRILAALAAGALAQASTGGDPGNAVAAANVNSRYTVESVAVSPFGIDRVSPSLRDRLQQFVGTRFDQSLIDDAAQRLRREFRNRPVTAEVSKGTSPDQLAVTFHVEIKDREFDVDLTNLLYHSKRNFSFGLDLAYRAEDNRVHFGALTDSDELVERYSGIAGGYQRTLAGGRLKVGAEAAAWRSQWSASTEAAAPDELYRTRTRFLPSATIELLKPLTLQLGVSLERLELTNPAARHELSSAAIGTLRFQRRWGLDTSGTIQRFEAAYGIRVGTSSLASDYAFIRHHGTARYGVRAGNQEILAAFQTGLLNGRAPLAERFVGGNSHILRGWNRWEIAPVGVDRLAHVSVDYRWRHLRLAYDAGSVWLRSGDPQLRQSVGIGFADNLWSGFSFLVAFPLRDGRMEPIFIAGMNF